MSEDRMSWLRHPLISIVLGFILTSVFGTAITQHFLDQREQEKLRAQMVLDRKQAIQQFSKSNEERTVRAEMMLKALRSDSNNDEIKTAREEYEKAYVAWSVERPGTLLLFRDLLSPENYDLVETGFKESQVAKIFDPIRQCLMASLAHGSDKAAVNKTLEACQIDELLELSSICSQALAVAVSDLAGTHSEWVSNEDMSELRQRARDSIDKQCP
jgi:cell division protein FtsB